MDITPQKYQQYVRSKSRRSPPGKGYGAGLCHRRLICAADRSSETDSGRRACPEDAGTATSVSLVFLSALLTGLGSLPPDRPVLVGRTLVTITGFANAVASPAIDFKAEGFVTGMAAKMFLWRGRSLVYGTLASVLYGLMLWLVG